MITSESESILKDLMSFLKNDNNTDDDLPQQIEKLGCQMHVAMVAAVVCPQRETHEVIELDFSSSTPNYIRLTLLIITIAFDVLLTYLGYLVVNR